MEKVIEEIEHLAPTTSENIDFKSWPLDLLVDYILKIHHRNIRTQGPEIEELLDKICRVHGEKHPSGRRPEIQGLASGADARLLTNFADTPTVLCGPGSIDNAHSINEYVPVDEYLAAVHMFCKLFTEWCGTAE